MNYIDIALIIILVGAIIRGAQSGSVRQLFSTIGFFVGIFLGAWIGPQIVQFAHTASSRSWLALLFTLGFGLGFLALGEYGGVWLKSKIVHKHLIINRFDGIFGAFVGGATLILLTWLI